MRAGIWWSRPPRTTGRWSEGRQSHPSSRLRCHHGVNVACAVAAVLRLVGGVDLAVDAGVGVHEGDVFLDATGPDAPFVTGLGGAEPGAAAPAPGSDVEVVAEANNPDRHRGSQRAVASYGRYLQFVCSSNLVEFVARPCRHRRISFVVAVVMTAFSAASHHSLNLRSWCGASARRLSR